MQNDSSSKAVLLSEAEQLIAYLQDVQRNATDETAPGLRKQLHLELCAVARELKKSSGHKHTNEASAPFVCSVEFLITDQNGLLPPPENTLNYQIGPCFEHHRLDDAFGQLEDVATFLTDHDCSPIGNSDPLEKPFEVISVCRTDVATLLGPRTPKTITDEEMESLARGLTEAYLCYGGYWEDLSDGISAVFGVESPFLCPDE